MTHIERLRRKQKLDLYSTNKEWAEALDLEIAWTGKRYGEVREDYLGMKPTYFNSGCCCFDEGNMTGIEIADGFIRLVRWENRKDEFKRQVLEERSLLELVKQMSPDQK
jgi:hypothetical protein